MVSSGPQVNLSNLNNINIKGGAISVWKGGLQGVYTKSKKYIEISKKVVYYIKLIFTLILTDRTNNQTLMILEKYLESINGLYELFRVTIGFLGLKVFDSKNSYKFSCSRKAQVIVVEKPQLNIISF